MLELQKVYRVSSKLTDDISVCISLDGNVGQNGIKQVQEFNEYLPIDSIILNKMDGTAKGGIALAILDKLSIPISFIGVGESYNDFISFQIPRTINMFNNVTIHSEQDYDAKNKKYKLDTLTTVYIGSISIIALYIAYRAIRKTI